MKVENMREMFQIFTRRFGFLNKNCCVIEDLELSTIHSHILYEVERRCCPSMQETAEALGTDITTFSRQVQSLIKMDLLQKMPHPDDRRVQNLSLTARGKKVAKIIDEQMKQNLEEIFSNVSDEEKEMILHSIQLLNKAMAKSNQCCKPMLYVK